MAKPKNRFDVQVHIPPITFGIKNRADVELTPEDVARCLEEFCARIRSARKAGEPRVGVGSPARSIQESNRADIFRSR